MNARTIAIAIALCSLTAPTMLTVTACTPASGDEPQREAPALPESPPGDDESAVNAESDGPGCIAASCDDGELPPAAEQTSLAGEALAPCSTDPMTGWFRDGHCRTDAMDRGAHVVCGVMTDEFLAYTLAQGNDLSTPRGSFPGLEPGDRWCLCASRWEEARQAGAATPVVLDATNDHAADLVSADDLRDHAADRDTAR